MIKIKLEKHHRKEFLESVRRGEVAILNCYEKISWVANSDINVEFYRFDKNKITTISKEDMKIMIENNWEVRPSK